jgi:membrane protease YdiL (CAAX protease family)
MILVVEVLASLVCFHFIRKKQFKFFHFSKKALFLSIGFSVAYIAFIFLTKNFYIGYGILGKFAQPITVLRPLLIALIFYPIIIAFSEELIFRLFLNQKYNILISSLLFTILHWRMGGFVGWMFVYLFIFGVAQCILFKQSKSLWAPIISHMAITYSLLLIYT